jgi:hypothetical protein
MPELAALYPLWHTKARRKGKICVAVSSRAHTERCAPPTELALTRENHPAIIRELRRMRDKPNYDSKRERISHCHRREGGFAQKSNGCVLVSTGGF